MPYRDYDCSEDELLGRLIDLECAKDDLLHGRHGGEALQRLKAIDAEQEMLRRLYHGDLE